VLIEVQGVTKTFVSRGGEQVVALAETTLDVQQGEFLTLIGPSGCGKSTLLRMLAGLVEPTSGRIVWQGTAPARGSEVGFVFQEPVLLPWLSVLDNVRFPLDTFGVDRRAGDEAARQTLELVGLKDFARALPKELSGGMKQRAAIARALVYKPRLVLMDEPFSALDLLTRDRMNDELLAIRAEVGATIVFVTHSVEEAAYLSDRVAVMSARPGQIRTIHTIDLPAPRGEGVKDLPAFHAWLSQLRRDLR
jgi:NitT/TauT family transport system ATP-binding protein